MDPGSVSCKRLLGAEDRRFVCNQAPSEFLAAFWIASILPFDCLHSPRQINDYVFAMLRSGSPQRSMYRSVGDAASLVICRGQFGELTSRMRPRIVLAFERACSGAGVSLA